MNTILVILISPIIVVASLLTGTNPSDTFEMFVGDENYISPEEMKSMNSQMKEFNDKVNQDIRIVCYQNLETNETYCNHSGNSFMNTTIEVNQKNGMIHVKSVSPRFGCDPVSAKCSIVEDEVE